MTTRALIVSLLVAVAAHALELRGRIEPAPARASVTLHGATSPYSDHTLSDAKGRFRFKEVPAGAYTLIVFIPGLGERRLTVEVSESLADAKGRVAVTFPFTESDIRSLEEHATVSVRELTIPNNAANEYRKAGQRLKQRDVEGAIRHLEKAVEIAPHFVAAWNHLGTIAYQTARYQEAERYFREALKHEAGAYEPVVNLGGTLLSLNRFEEALRYNLYALAERPADPLANSQTGLNYYFLGDEEKALGYLKEAKRIDPAHFSHPQLILARIYAGRGARQSAIAELTDFLARHPDAPEAPQARQWLEKLRQQE